MLAGREDCSWGASEDEIMTEDVTEISPIFLFAVFAAVGLNEVFSVVSLLS